MSQIEQKQKLLAIKAELQQRISKIEADLSHRQTSHKFSEQAVERHNDDVLLNLKAEAEDELGLIEKALARIERNVYGTCEKCHQEIANERLNAIPFTAFCAQCAV